MRLFTMPSRPLPAVSPFLFAPICLAVTLGAISNLAHADTDTDSPTSDIELISLKEDALFDAVNIETMPDDDIDAVADDSFLAEDDIVEDEVAIDSQAEDLSFERTVIPAETARVPLNAISPDTLKTFVSVIDLVRREYIFPVNDETLFDNAMSGMLTKLDSHAEFLDNEAFENLRAFTEGDVGDVGAAASYDPKIGFWVITEVIDNSPADKKGIAIGDYLHQIGEFKLDESRTANDVEQLLTGIAGSQVDVVVSKAGRRKRSFTLQRNNMHAQTIQTRVVDGMAIIKLPAFQNNSRERIIQSLTELDASVTGILLDVRDNPGGVLTSAINVASLFMSDTDVVQVKGRHGAPKTLTTQGNAILKPLPLVILQNRYSASAAEVLASSLQAQDRATIVGEVSYGKGSVQSVLPLNDEQAIKLTVAHYLTAKGAPIDKIGVMPDVILRGNESTWEAQALDILREKARPSKGFRFIKKDPQKDADASQ